MIQMRSNAVPLPQLVLLPLVPCTTNNMRGNLPSRLCLGAVMAVLLGAVPAFAHRRAPAPPADAKPNRPPSRPAVRPPAKAPKQEHLQQWMESRKNLSVPDQQRELEKLPGFKDLPPLTQQRYRDRLAQLNNMTPQQRERLLERNEELENHTPEQREQFRQGMQQFDSLPPNRKLVFKKAYHDLREMPPAQRQSVINSEPFRAQFPENERNALSNVLAVEPYPPVKTGTAEGPLR